MSTIKVDTIATRTGSGNITLSNNVASLTSAGAISGTNLSASGTLAVTGNTTMGGTAAITCNTTVGCTLVNTGLVTASAGVAIGGTGSANTLDDYEEGTWTPSVGGNASYHLQSGTFTKIGRLVHAHGVCQVNVLGTGSTTTMSGFPFASVNSGGANMSGSIGLFLYLAVNVLNLEMYFSNGNTVTAFKGNTSASGNQSGNLAIFGNNARVDFSITYETS